MRSVRTSLVGPTTSPLVGASIALHPLSRRDLAEIARVPDDPAWALLLRRPAGGDVNAEGWLADAMRGVRRGTERCWTIRDAADGRLLGSTRYLNVDAANRRLEIGATWLLPEARGSSANAESKLLLLDHAFHDLGMLRVHIQADVRNERSRRAIEALGATFEGVLRRHIMLADGTSRDTAVYSILADEWLELRAEIVARIAGRSASWRGQPSSLVPQDPEPLIAASRVAGTPIDWDAPPFRMALG